ncbi:MAG: enoyl-CoA hydratase/isomerase family protein [Pseudomonadota bacterium]
MSDIVSIETDGRIAIVRFDRGDKANALNARAIADLTEAARSLHDRPDLSAVILAGRAENFCMGADLKERSGAARQGLADRRVSLRAGPRLCQAWEEVDALTICAIEGWCVGGGAALAAACDLRVMAASATYYVPEIARGMNMTWGTVPRLTALIGPARTKRIVALCEKVGAETAEEWGLADKRAADGGAVEAARGFADAAAELPPTPLKMTKHDVNIAAHALLRATSHREMDAFALTETSDDLAEGVAAFLEKRAPKFTGN